MMEKRLKDKLLNLGLWIIPLLILLFCFYRFGISPNVWILIFSCIASLGLGFLLKNYIDT